MSLYLYWRDDQDLIALKASCRKDFLGVVRDCMAAYLDGDDYKLPAARDAGPSYENEMVTLSFSDEKDAKAIEFLSRQPKGQQSNAVKFVLRHYMHGFRDRNYFSGPLPGTEVKLRLSTGHDSDLLCLYCYDKAAFPGWVSDAARAFVRGEKHVFHVPDDWGIIQKKPPRTCTATVCFGDQDKDVIRYLDGIQDGLREPALKGIFRGSFDRPILCTETGLGLTPGKEAKKPAHAAPTLQDWLQENKPARAPAQIGTEGNQEEEALGTAGGAQDTADETNGPQPNAMGWQQSQQPAYVQMGQPGGYAPQGAWAEAEETYAKETATETGAADAADEDYDDGWGMDIFDAMER